MIIANAKNLKPDEEGLIFRMKCRVSRWFGAKCLSFLFLFLFWSFFCLVFGLVLLLFLGQSLYGLFILIFICVVLILSWQSYDLLWKQTVSVYDRGDQVEIQLDDRLYRFDWRDLYKIRVYKIPGRHDAISSLNLVMKFQERTFRLTADENIYELEKLIKVLRKKLEQYRQGT